MYLLRILRNCTTIIFITVRYDWYQTDKHVILTVLIKKLKEKEVEVGFGGKSVS